MILVSMLVCHVAGLACSTVAQCSIICCTRGRSAVLLRLGPMYSIFFRRRKRWGQLPQPSDPRDTPAATRKMRRCHAASVQGSIAANGPLHPPNLPLQMHFLQGPIRHMQVQVAPAKGPLRARCTAEGVEDHVHWRQGRRMPPVTPAGLGIAHQCVPSVGAPASLVQGSGVSQAECNECGPRAEMCGWPECCALPWGPSAAIGSLYWITLPVPLTFDESASSFRPVCRPLGESSSVSSLQVTA